MKLYLAAIGAILLTASAAPGQSIPLQISTPTAAATPAKAEQVVKGRIATLDTNAGTFSVKAAGSKKTMTLKVGGDIEISKLRRGQRVIVTYSDGVASKIEATRSIQ